MNIRRQVDTDDGERVIVLSPIEYLNEGAIPAQLYTSFDPATMERTATMVKASPKRICVVLLIHSNSDQQTFMNAAKAALRSLVVDQ